MNSCCDIYILEGAHTRIIWRGTTLWALSTLYFMEKKLSYIAFAKFIIVKKTVDNSIVIALASMFQI